MFAAAPVRRSSCFTGFPRTGPCFAESCRGWLARLRWSPWISAGLVDPRHSEPVRRRDARGGHSPTRAPPRAGDALRRRPRQRRHGGYALARLHPQATRGVMILDVPIPGLEPWEQVKADPALWHFGFHQTSRAPERLIAGREAIYFREVFFNRLARDPGAISTTTWLTMCARTPRPRSFEPASNSTGRIPRTSGSTRPSASRSSAHRPRRRRALARR